MAVSLSHSAGVGFAAAVAGDADIMRIGCDIEAVAPRSDAFVSDYFAAEEAAWIRAGGTDGHVRANLVWSAKESVLKALGEGLRKDTRSVVVEVGGLLRLAAAETAPAGFAPAGLAASGGHATTAWRPFTASTESRDDISGWWRVADGLVWTVVGWNDEGAHEPPRLHARCPPGKLVACPESGSEAATLP